MRRNALKYRHGGLDLTGLERRVLDGDVRAMRPLVRQAGINTLELRFRDVELRSSPNGTGGERLLFTGYASITGTPFTINDWMGEYTETMEVGCFGKTLGAPNVTNERGAWSTRPDVIFAFNHNWDDVPLARTKGGTNRLAADDTGLLNEADLDPGRDDVNRIRSAMDAGDLDAMSLAFWATRQLWDDDLEQRQILEVDMDGGDTSIVTWPANPYTTGTTQLRSVQARALMRTNIPGILVQRAKIEIREGKTLSAATTEALTSMQELLTDAGESHSAALDLLADLLGTEDSSTDDGDSEQEGATPTGAETLDSGAPSGDAVPEQSSRSSVEVVRAREAERARQLARR